MINTYSVGLSLLDFVPNLAFLVGSYFIVRLVMLRSDPYCIAATITGSSLVFLGGTLKAIWKLLYTIGVGDFQLLSELQFILLAPGFLLLLVGVVLLAKHEKIDWKTSLMSIAPWKIPLLAIMTVCSLAIHSILSYLTFRRKKYLAGVMYIVAIFCMLGMAVMASSEQTIGQQWIEESINSMGQIAYAVGSYLFYSHVKLDGYMYLGDQQ